MILRLTIAAIAALIPIAITLFGLYDEHRLMDVVAHLSSGVFFGAVLDPWTDAAGVFFLAIATVLGIALFWEWLEPKFQRFVGDMDVGYEDTVGDVLAVVLGAALIMIVL